MKSIASWESCNYTVFSMVDRFSKKSNPFNAFFTIIDYIPLKAFRGIFGWYLNWKYKVK